MGALIAQGARSVPCDDLDAWDEAGEGSARGRGYIST